MASIGDDHQRPYVPTIQRQKYRYQLFRAIRKKDRYKNVVDQDLRPLWKIALTELPHPDHAAAKFATIRMIGRPAANRPAVIKYIQAVDQAAESFLLTFEGEPAPWACDFIHADVEPLRVGPDGFVDPDPFESNSPLRANAKPSSTFNAAYEFLTIMVNPAVAEIYTGQFPDAIDTPHQIPAGEFMQFAEWEVLETAAHSMLDELLLHLRDQYEEWYPVQDRPSTRKSYATDASNLADLLMDNAKRSLRRDDAQRKRIQRFAAMIRLDYPGQKHKPKLES